MFHVKHPQYLVFDSKKKIFYKFPERKKKVKQVEIEIGK